MSYSGLRGAVAFGLALISYNELAHVSDSLETCARDEITVRKNFITTTLAVVFFTVFIQGATVKYWMKLLHIKFDTDESPSLSTTVHGTAIDHILSGIEEITGSIGHHRVRDWWERIDARLVFIIVDIFIYLTILLHGTIYRILNILLISCDQGWGQIQMYFVFEVF